MCGLLCHTKQTNSNKNATFNDGNLFFLRLAAPLGTVLCTEIVRKKLYTSENPPFAVGKLQLGRHR
jgi:hypothetical protein